MTEAPLLEVEQLNLRFHRYEGVSHVLRDVNLAIRRGEQVALVGESGCGKSVFMRSVLGLMDSRSVDLSGSIRFHGTELTRLSGRAWRRLRGRQVTMVFQDPIAALNPVFTIGDQLTEVILRGGEAMSRRDAMQRGKEALARVAIDEPERVLSSYPFQLSGGMNQRVLITMALVNGPELVLADEPGTALDVTVQEQTLRLMRRLSRESGAAVLLVAHNLGVVRTFAERVYVMYAGTVVESGPVDKVFGSPAHPYTRALMAAVPRLTGEGLPKPIEGGLPDYTQPPGGCRFEPRCPHAMPACRTVPRYVDLGGEHRVLCVLHDDRIVPGPPGAGHG